MKLTVNWPTVAIAGALLAVALLLFFFGRDLISPDSYAKLSLVLVGLVVGAMGQTSKALERAEATDTDGDGTPDWRDPSPRGSDDDAAL